MKAVNQIDKNYTRLFQKEMNCEVKMTELNSTSVRGADQTGFESKV